MLKKTIMSVCVVAVFAVALVAGVPKMGTDYKKIAELQNGRFLYFCQDAHFEYIEVEETTGSDGRAIYISWRPYGECLKSISTANPSVIPTDYTKVDDGERLFDVYYCPWAGEGQEILLIKVHYYQGAAVSASKTPYGSLVYMPVSCPTYKDVPPGFTYEGTFPNGFRLFKAVSPHLMDKWMWGKLIEVPECTGSGVNMVTIGTLIYPVAE